MIRTGRPRNPDLWSRSEELKWHRCSPGSFPPSASPPFARARYASTLSRAAKGYKVDTRGRATRTDLPPARSNVATGLISTARDLARFDAGLRYNILLRPETQLNAWTSVGPGFPTGLGWFVQSYNGVPVIWQFGTVPDAFSSLMLKVPTRGLTLILLANSDGLSPPLLALEKSGDVTASVFARTFLRMYVP